MKTPFLTPEYEFPELECENGYQTIQIDFRDDANELIILTFVTIYIKLEKSGDGDNTPYDITEKINVHSIEYHCFDFDGKRVIDEEGVIYKELEKIIKWEYEN